MSKRARTDVEPEIPTDMLNAVDDLPPKIRVDDINKEVDLDPVPAARKPKAKPTKKAEQLLQAAKNNALTAKPVKGDGTPKPRTRKPAKPRASKAAGKSKGKQPITPKSATCPDKFFTPKSKKKKKSETEIDVLTEAFRNSQCSQDEPLLEEIQNDHPSEPSTIVSSNQSVCPLEDLNVNMFENSPFMYSSSLYASDASLGLIRDKLLMRHTDNTHAPGPIRMLHDQQRQHMEECFGMLIDRQHLQRAQLEESLKET